ncbi:MAG: hypothetical protein ACRELA_18885 [Candidatus Rokuibacteriota bacterium]
MEGRGGIVNLKLDENLSRHLAPGLRAFGHDVVVEPSRVRVRWPPLRMDSGEWREIRL